MAKKKEIVQGNIEAIDVSTLNIADLTHPNYQGLYDDWTKWRLTFKSGKEFIKKYLKKFSTRESDPDFTNRQEISYVPAFAKAAVGEVKDAIFQRISDVTRTGGPKSYQDGVRGLSGGVDLAGTTINNYIGTTVLPELLMMGKVGVFVDMPPFPGQTLRDQQGSRPYIYHYAIEDILNWTIDTENEKTFNKLLLRDNIFKVCEVTGLPKEETMRYRFIWVQDEKVCVQFFDVNSKPVDRFGNPGVNVTVLDIPTIPFVLFEITDSLLRDIADYQVALLNLASSDIGYALKCNFPFYVEQYDPKTKNLFHRPSGHNKVHTGDSSVQIVQGGEQADATVAKDREIELGSTIGRRVPKGMELPAFIHPSSEPLLASMKKQDELKQDIKHLVKLAVSNLAPKMASAESKSYDERSLEAGLSAIALELERGELTIAKYWQMYENTGGQAMVMYPKRYSLETDSERRREAKDLLDSTKIMPSVTFRREAMKQTTVILLGSKISNEKMEAINEEIDSADVVVNPDELHRDIELCLVDPETASKAKGYPEGSVEKAKEAHAERVERIAQSQAKARGVTDLGGISNASRDEKMNKDAEETPAKKTRGSEK